MINSLINIQVRSEDKDCQDFKGKTYKGQKVLQERQEDQVLLASMETEASLDCLEIKVSPELVST